MKISHLAFKNYRGFKSFECDLEPDLNVLVGQNGHGKSTVLDALAVSLGQFVGGFGPGKDKGIETKDIHLAKLSGGFSDGFSDAFQKYAMEHQFPVEISASSFESEYLPCTDWTRRRNTLKGKTTQVRELKNLAATLQKQVQDNEPVILPLVSYYGTGRLWNVLKLSSKATKTLKEGSRLDGYLNCLNPSSTYNAFSNWLRQETISDYEHRMKLIEHLGFEDAYVKGETIHGRLIKAVQRAIDTVLEPSGWGHIRYSANQHQIVATHIDDGDVPVSSLSDGVRNMIGMIADIAYRAVRLNPHLIDKAVTGTPGIVLIDEVDMHLHARWQQTVLLNLKEAFPNIQFIVTTHSPQVLSTVKRGNIRILENELGVGTAVKPLGTTFAESSADILERVLSVKRRPQLTQVTLFEDYMKLVNQGLSGSTDAKNLRNQLENLLGKQHNDLLMADRAIRRKEFLANAKNQ
ncbi:AAA family ATPase [Thalassotalea crassostreae]|uniref:AAA family ATPase n=1 Tax=Thalassotalea crassostreae TaxID=1763536 RepID=UPI000837ACBA|nr:AAA family ATPase [Thalassotalea crassostreae]